MASIIGLFSGGTTGARDGTLISYADAETNAYAPAALDTQYTLHYRVIDDVTLDDPGYDVGADFDVTAPTGIQVSANGSDWATTVKFPAATGGNKVLYIKQTARQLSAEADLRVAVGGYSVVAGTRVAQVGTITLTPDFTSIVADCADVASADGYEWDISTSNTFATYTRTTTVSSTQTFTGLTVGTTYYVRGRAFDERGVGAYSATANTATGNLIYANNFDSDTTDALPSGWAETDVSAPFSSPWLVKTGGLNGSAKALRATISSVENNTAYYAFTERARVRASWRGKTGATVTSGNRHGTYALRKGGSNVALLALKDGQVQAWNGSAFANVGVALSANTEYALTIDYDASTDTYRAWVNGTEYTNGGSPWLALSAQTGVVDFACSSATAPNGEYAYIDELSLYYL